MNGSGLITRRGFIGGALLAGLGGKALAQGFAGLGESADGFAPVVPGRTFAFPADHGPHPEFRIEWWYVTANLADAQRRGLWRAMDAVSPGDRGRARTQEGWANQQIWMGHAAVTRADTHRFSRGVRARRRRPGRRRRKAVSRLDRCLGDARARSGERRQYRAARTEGIGRRFQLRAAPRRGPAAGAAGRRRLQPQIAARTGLLLLQPAALHGEGQPHHRRQACRRHRAWPGSIASGAASRWPPIKADGTGSRCISTPATS